MVVLWLLREVSLRKQDADNGISTLGVPGVAAGDFAQLVARAQHGDAEAMERLLKDYGDAIQREIRFCLLARRPQRRRRVSRKTRLLRREEGSARGLGDG